MTIAVFSLTGRLTGSEATASRSIVDVSNQATSHQPVAASQIVGSGLAELAKGCALDIRVSDER
ncbi:MAG: hypothetical protein KJ066_19810 [Acidobacteria bacterium]|nr:hypothetical protein [Acidobacteriota bacterium]